MSGSTSTGIPSGNPPRASCSPPVLFGLYRMGSSLRLLIKHPMIFLRLKRSSVVRKCDALADLQSPRSSRAITSDSGPGTKSHSCELGGLGRSQNPNPEPLKMGRLKLRARDRGALVFRKPSKEKPRLLRGWAGASGQLPCRREYLDAAQAI